MTIRPAWRHPTAFAVVGALLMLPTFFFVASSMLAYELDLTAVRDLVAPIQAAMTSVRAVDLLLVAAPALAAVAALRRCCGFGSERRDGTLQAVVTVRALALNVAVGLVAIGARRAAGLAHRGRIGAAGRRVGASVLDPVLDLPGVIEGVPRRAPDEVARAPWPLGVARVLDRRPLATASRVARQALRRTSGHLVLGRCLRRPAAQRTQVGDLGLQHVAGHLGQVAPSAARPEPQPLALG